MNTLEIRLSKEKASKLTEPLLQSVELFLARKSIFLLDEEKAHLLDDMSSFLSRINLAIGE